MGGCTDGERKLSFAFGFCCAGEVSAPGLGPEVFLVDQCFAGESVIRWGIGSWQQDREEMVAVVMSSSLLGFLQLATPQSSLLSGELQL